MPRVISITPTPVKIFQQKLPKHMKKSGIQITTYKNQPVQGPELAMAIDRYYRRTSIEKV